MTEETRGSPGGKAGFQMKPVAKVRMVRIILCLVLAAGCSFSAGAAAQAGHANVCEREMARAAELHDVPLGILYAVGLTETGRGDGLRPYALNIDGHAIYDLKRDEAVAQIRRSRARGIKLIDVGCMQINHYWHADKFRSLEDMLDPARNVAYAAAFLKQLYIREGSWVMAVARYHAGPNNDAAQKRYVCRVIDNMVATGFADWTQSARKFCGR